MSSLAWFFLQNSTSSILDFHQEMLEQSNVLYLNLSYCNISEESLPCLRNFLQLNRTLITLRLTSLRLYDGLTWRDELRKAADDYHSCCTLILDQPLREELEQTSNTNTLSVTRMNLREDDVSDLSVALMRKPVRWTSLRIDIGRLSPRAIQSLAEGLSNFGLTELGLVCDKIREECAAVFFSTLSKCDQLKILKVNFSDLRSAVAGHLGHALTKNHSLTTLRLHTSGDTAENALVVILKALEINNKITGLILSFSDDGQTYARQLKEGGLGHVTKLDLRQNSLRPEGIRLLSEALEGNNRLEEINLSGNSIGYKGTRHLASLLEKNSTITKLVLDANRFGPRSALELSKAIAENCTLKEISLRKNTFDNDGGEYFALALEKNTSVTKLNLYRNEIGDRGAGCIARSLTINGTLQELDLGRNRIGNQGGAALAEALVENHTLQKLSLECTQIGDEGARGLALGIGSNPTLNDINLSENQIGAEGYSFLIPALEKSQSLVKLRLGECEDRINDEIGVVLVSALAKVHTLRELHLHKNRIGDRTLARLCQSFLTSLDYT